MSRSARTTALAVALVLVTAASLPAGAAPTNIEPSTDTARTSCPSPTGVEVTSILTVSHDGAASKPVARGIGGWHDRMMDAGRRVARSVLEEARRTFVDNVRDLTLEEALGAGGGYRSILGLMKHTAGWSEVYHSFAFDPEPRRWDDADWPRGLRERIEPSLDYVGEVLAWFEHGAERWLASVDDAVDLDEPRPVHWGERHPLRAIVAMVAGHWQYHAGEINAILAILRGEAWELGEAVEENHISTVGRSVRSPWISDEDAERYEERLRELAGEREEGA
jgi:hypothetical protein